MKKTYKTAILTIIIFALSSVISTLGCSVVDPSIGDIRVVRYGFPLPCLKATPPSCLFHLYHSTLWFQACSLCRFSSCLIA